MGHPRPPAGFAPVEDQAGVSRLDGHRPEVRANTSILLDGVPTATLWLDQGSQCSAQDWAAICVHECSHVLQRRVRPGWKADEMRLVSWPHEDIDEPAWRRLESDVLGRAVEATDRRESAALTA